ncbi:RNA polymerase subunit sigma-70 [Nonomuraea sp. LPB2021202275-12-8]|uniref:RNA polymerase subunit sigma-70 n=1 Tax=Nonomuraea sp. LPB2021202275-12-8 TaxID=3120159 RepID=UPI00300C33E4
MTGPQRASRAGEGGEVTASIQEGEGDEVAALIRAGDQAGFAELAERHRHELQVHCYRMLGSYTDAEDMVQEALLRAWRRRETFEGRSTFRAWLYRIATNVCLDALSGPARSREVVMTMQGADRSALAEVPWLQPYPDRLLDLAGPGEGEPDAVAVARETIELAYLAAIQHLPARQRAVLILRDVAGWPATETAGALELSVTAVKSALQRARATLRLHLPEQRSQWSPATEPSDEEKAVLRRYMRASEEGDLVALAALLREDARQAMPPAVLLYAGREAILDMWRPVLEGPQAWGEWRSILTSANRRPAVANYVRRDGETSFTAVNLDVVRIEEGLIVEITTFGPDVLPAFGLPEVL